MCTETTGGFICLCPNPYYGKTCELGSIALDDVNLEDGGDPPTAPQINVAELSECPTDGPTACQQLCTASYYSFECSCIPGFRLQSDKRTCEPKVKFPCGQVPGGFNSTRSMCQHGKCPWQVSLMNSRGLELCGGVVLGRHSVLTAASCLFIESGPEYNPKPSDFYVIAARRGLAIKVRALYIHSRYRKNHHDNDLVLIELAVPVPFSSRSIHLCLPTKDFCENILMQSGRTGIAMREEYSPTEQLVYMTLDECRVQLNASQPLSNKMFCMKTQHEPSGTRTRAQRSLHGHVGSQNETQGEQEGLLKNQNDTQKRLSGQGVNQSQTLESQNAAGDTDRCGYNFCLEPEEDSRLRDEVDSRRCDGILQGTPVVTMDQGTVFVTGLLMPSSAGCNGGSGKLVFTKLSRYLNWINPRLEVVEDRMTPQVNQYPGSD
ncbi:protein Z%2C vitamin K-dependent plasma glycoprotein b [Xyrichtys novacula]|nr:protein Z%2C vitamin K-dependent plasma glycoprotein b [Xyrichtys novacula]